MNCKNQTIWLYPSPSKIGPPKPDLSKQILGGPLFHIKNGATLPLPLGGFFQRQARRQCIRVPFCAVTSKQNLGVWLAEPVTRLASMFRSHQILVEPKNHVSIQLPPKTKGWILYPKWWGLGILVVPALNTAMFGIYVRFLGRTPCGKFSNSPIWKTKCLVGKRKIVGTNHLFQGRTCYTSWGHMHIIYFHHCIEEWIFRYLLVRAFP